MKPLTREWIEKAEGDYHAVGMLLRARKHPNYDASYFHAQQCAEEYMKATLIEAGSQFERTHDLSTLLDQLKAINPFWEALRHAATILSDYAVRFRYPGSADKAMAKSALQACEFLRESLREHLISTVASRQPKAKSRPRKHRESKSKGE